MEKFLHDMSWVVPLRSDWATAVADGFNYLGYAPFFIMALPLAYWLWDKGVGTRLTVLVVLVAVTNGFLKDLFDDPRPPGELQLDPRVDRSYGLPSGHAQIGVAMWLWIAYELKQRWFWPIAILIALGVCLSRLYVAVHDVEDVLAGIALGLVSIGLVMFFVSDAFKGWRALNPAIQIGAILLAHPLIWLVWPEPGGPGTKIAIGGMLVGWWAGVLLDQRAIHYQRHPNWAIAIAAAAVGLAIILIGLTKIAAPLEAAGLWPPAARWLQSFAIAFFATAVGPWLFQKLGAARSSAAPSYVA